MDDRQLIEDLLSALEYHTEQTRPIEFSKVAIEAAREYLRKPAQQEPVAWLLTDKNINSLQVDSIQRLIDRLKHAHHTDLCVRINGQDEWFQADWLKHMVRVAPPQRKPLTDDKLSDIWFKQSTDWMEFARAIEAAHGIGEKNEH